MTRTTCFIFHNWCRVRLRFMGALKGYGNTSEQHTPTIEVEEKMCLDCGKQKVRVVAFKEAGKKEIFP